MSSFERMVDDINYLVLNVSQIKFEDSFNVRQLKSATNGFVKQCVVLETIIEYSGTIEKLSETRNEKLHFEK